VHSLSARALDSAFGRLRGLTHVALKGLDNLGDAAVAALVTGCGGQLQSLLIQWCGQLTDAALGAVLAEVGEGEGGCPCPRLRVFMLRGSYVTGTCGQWCNGKFLGRVTLKLKKQTAFQHFFLRKYINYSKTNLTIFSTIFLVTSLTAWRCQQLVLNDDSCCRNLAATPNFVSNMTLTPSTTLFNFFLLFTLEICKL
jgi:hypothetical protein